MNKTNKIIKNNNRVKIFNENSASDLQIEINKFLSKSDVEVIDIEYVVSSMNASYCYMYSALVLYTLNESVLDKKFE